VIGRCVPEGPKDAGFPVIRGREKPSRLSPSRRALSRSLAPFAFRELARFGGKISALLREFREIPARVFRYPPIRVRVPKSLLAGFRSECLRDLFIE